MMNESSGNVPLLPKKEDELGCFKKPSLVISSAKLVIKAAILIIFVAWAAFIFLFPLPLVNNLFEKWNHATEGTVFGLTGSIFLLFSSPILIIAFLAIAYLILAGEDDIQEKKTGKYPSLSLWTFPVLVDGIFGVVTAAELIGIILFTLYFIWAISVFTIRNQDVLSWFDVPAREKSALILELTGLRFGFIGLMCLAFLFLPVSRGSVLLRFIHIPFEHATRYHVWLGHLTMSVFTLHGLFYVIAWAKEGRLIHQLTEWKDIGIANLPGVISLLSGLLMWVTSLPGVRRINFELFFYTHQLYVVFVVFLALHVGDFIFTMAAAGIFLFMLDRFLRFCQSRRTVDILSAKYFPCGTVELVLSKPANLHYNALGWVFLHVRELSLLQWHPFSVSSSPLEGKNSVSILIKVLGGWTGKLKEHILNISKYGPQAQLLEPGLKISASVEGPYGHESPYHLSYENLILVAGGIGISPFLAILSDVLHHIRDGKPCLPKNILIVWAVKKSDELPLLETVNMDSICPFFSESLNLEIQTYVTRQSEPLLEEGKVHEPESSCVFHHWKKNRMSVLVGTGNIIWSGMYVVISTIGLFILVGLLDYFYINPFNITTWWYKGLLLVACMAGSVLVFGGLTIGLWHLWEMKTSNDEEWEDSKKTSVGHPPDGPLMPKKSGQAHYVNSIRYGQRPNFGEIFGRISERWGSVDIGVIVCGPSTLETSVARECKAHNLERRNNQPIFHFHTHSFDL